MSKWIIFGASGFVGQALLPLLDTQGIAYIAPASKALDLASPDAVQKIAEIAQDGDRVLMLSAYTPEKGDARDLTLKNLLMIRHLLAGIEQRKIEHFIYVSSDAVYPLTSDVVDEATPATPYGLYGYMHAMREQYAKDAFPPDKLTILRPCAIYGKGDTHYSYGINRFVRSALEQGEIALFGGGEEYRDHIHVGDVAAILLSIQQQKITGTFNAASGTSWRFLEIAQFIQSHLPKKVAIIHKPRSSPIFHRHVDISKLCTAFPGQQPRTIDVGITQLLKPHDR